jgi:hypothetical protein
MKRLTIKYVNKEEFEMLRKKYTKAQYYECKKYLKLKISPHEEVRCLR